MTETAVSYRSPSYYEIALDQERSWRDYRDEGYREYRRLWEQRPRDLDPGDFPLHLDIDPTNACNLKCTMCPRTHYLKTGNKAWSPGGRIGFMDLALFKRVIDQGAAHGAYSIKLNYLGEPLLHPRVVDMVAYASRQGLEVMMNTNAVLLTPEMSRRLLDAGVADIFFSVDSPYPAEYEAIRVGADFHKVISNIGLFVDLKDRGGFHHVQTRVSMVLDPHEPDPQRVREDFRLLFTSLGVAEIGFGLPTDMKVDYWKKYGRIDGFTCRDIYQRLFVFWDGAIGPCCGEWERGYLVGDARYDDLAQVWNSEKYRALRRAHEERQYETVKICRACSVPWLSIQEV